MSRSVKRDHFAEARTSPELRATRFTMNGEDYVIFSAPIVRLEGIGNLLTAAERAVAALVLEGLTNTEIAKRRSCSPRTIANQLASIYGKLGVRSRSELAARCGASLTESNLRELDKTSGS